MSSCAEIIIKVLHTRKMHAHTICAQHSLQTDLSRIIDEVIVHVER